MGEKFKDKHPKLANFIEEKAPKLGNMIGAFLPNSGTLGIIKNLISSDPDLSDKDKEEALKLANEAQSLHLQEEALRQDEYKTMLADTADARSLAIKLQGDKPSWLAKNMGFLLDIMTGLVWGTLTVVIALRQLKVVEIGGADFTGVLSLYATVTAVFMSSLNFHRGSTQTSRDKQKTIDHIMEKKVEEKAA